MKPFSTFLDLLGKIEDPRRAEGKLYRLPHVILFAILASIAGANSYRSVHTFIRVHLPRLRKLFRLKWRRAPAYTTIRGILLQLDPAGVERVFRTLLAEASDTLQRRDYHALRLLCGSAPVTRRSGKSCVVVRRYACNHRLRNATYHWAQNAIQHDPTSRAKYDALRAKGHGHARALRSYQLGLDLPLCFETKSTTIARDPFYSFDNIGRFRAAQTPEASSEPKLFPTFNAPGTCHRACQFPGGSRMGSAPRFQAWRAPPGGCAHRRDRQG